MRLDISHTKFGLSIRSDLIRFSGRSVLCLQGCRECIFQLEKPWFWIVWLLRSGGDSLFVGRELVIQKLFSVQAWHSAFLGILLLFQSQKSFSSVLPVLLFLLQLLQRYKTAIISFICFTSVKRICRADCTFLVCCTKISSASFSNTPLWNNSAQ